MPLFIELVELRIELLDDKLTFEALAPVAPLELSELAILEAVFVCGNTLVVGLPPD